MPTELTPVVRRQPTYPKVQLGGDWGWLDQQDYHPDVAWARVGNFRRGTITGGPSLTDALKIGDYRAFAVTPPPQPLSAPVLAGERVGPRTRIGTVELDMVDPFATLTQATGEAFGLTNPVVGDRGGFDPLMFLNSKDMDLFGRGDVGMPSRLADYALAFPIAMMNKLRGIRTAAPGVNADLPYRFQEDPSYWQLVGSSNDEGLREIARVVAGQYVDPSRNSYLVDQLYQQFAKDRNALTQLTSGNDAIDYRAKKDAYGEAVWGPGGGILNLGKSGGFQSLPVIGTQLAQFFDAVDPEEEAYWQSLAPDERAAALARSGFIQMGSDFIAALPALSGMGMVLSAAKGAGGLAGNAYRAYDLTLRSANWMMAAGVVAATTNWALEAAVPGYSEFLGEEVDRARPISRSVFAGVVNEVGFWSSGTFGVATLAGVGRRVAGRGIGVASRAADAGFGMGLGKADIGLGKVSNRELEFYRQGHGGSMVRNELARAGLAGIETSSKRVFLSYALNRLEAMARQGWDAAVRGHPTGDARIDGASPELKLEMADHALGRRIASLGSELEPILRAMALARQPRPVNAAREIMEGRRVADNLARTFDNQLASSYVHDYGPAFITRLVGKYTPEAMEAWARAKVDALGGDGNALGRHGTDDWAKIVRSLHQLEFDGLNGELHAAMEGAEEAGRLSMFSQRTLFADEADELLRLLAAGDEKAARAELVRLVRDKEQVERWFAEDWHPREGVDKLAENIPLSVAMRWLQDVRLALPHRRILPSPDADTALMPLNALHRSLEEAGTWTLGFKPVNEAGDFVSYARTRSGNTFKSPWIDYPLENADNIELGNRGWLASKYDSIFAGFRTWRIVEFQRGMLFRSLTGRYEGITPAQIDNFHEGVLRITRDARVQPQTLGTAPIDAPLVKLLDDQLETLVKQTFGTGPLRRHDGTLEQVGIRDWRQEIATAYRQSLKLNLSAGLTSHLKSRFGMAGEAAAWGADVAYVQIRFNMSPIFKGGEFGESAGFNAMRGVDPRGDPITEALFYKGGIGDDYGVVGTELNYDQVLQGLGERGTRGQRDSGARFAATMSFYARKVPEDFALRAEGAATRAAADAIPARRRALEETIESLRRDGEAVDPDTDLIILTSNDVIADLERRIELTESFSPELPPLAEDRQGLLRQLRSTMAQEPIEPHQRGNALRSELDDLIGENGVHPGLEGRAQEILDELEAIELQNPHNRQADRFEDIPATPEALEAALRTKARAEARNRSNPTWRQQAWDTFWHPTAYKQHQADLLQMKLMADEFPTLLRLSGNEGAVKVFTELGIPENKWAEFLLRDRELLDDWINVQAAGEDGTAALEALFDHAGGAKVQREFDELYGSEGWQAITSLWALNAKATMDEAFRVHFFNPYRSAFERSINHPLTGIYPASWAYKAAREWARFMFNNRTFGELRLGMTPAVALAEMVRAQNASFAQENDESLAVYLEDGPLGSTFFIFNLLMPGDWSAIPFPASRTIREIARGRFDPGSILASNLAYMGLTRDLRLFDESLGEIHDLVLGPAPEEVDRLRLWSVRGLSGPGGYAGEARR